MSNTTNTTPTIDLNRMLQPSVKYQLRQAAEAAKWDGNDGVNVNTGNIIAFFCDTLTVAEYDLFNWEEAENFLLDYAQNIFKTL